MKETGIDTRLIDSVLRVHGHGTLVHDFFEGFEVNRIHVFLLVLTYDLSPLSFILSLLCLVFVRFFLNIFALLVALVLYVYISRFCQLEVFDQSLDRDHSVIGNRIKRLMKVLFAH